MENRHASYDLAQLQSLPLRAKIQASKNRIRQWYEAFNGDVYVSFSGGKDSTVLLHLVRSMYPEVEAVFSDTGLEYPEIRAFVREHDNVTIIRPEMNFRRVILEKGYPIVSKEVSQNVREARIGLEKGDGSYWYRIAKFEGTYLTKAGNKSLYNCEKWKFLLDAPFKISEQCCTEMKKKPFKAFEKRTGKKPYVGTMASESLSRKSAWLRFGCNAFESKRPKSAPLSFWTEQDILHYLQEFNVPYCSVYGEIVETGKEIEIPLYGTIKELKTTACDRTGCMFCMFGCHIEKEPNRFQRMKENYPKQYDYCMRPVENGGLGMGELLDYIGVPH